MDKLAQKVAGKFAAMSEDKLKEVMLKIRKGAASSLTWSQLGEVLANLDPGWKLEKSVGLVKMYGYKGGEDRPAIYVSLRDSDSGDVEKKHAEMAKDAVTSLPSSPKHGKLYVLELGRIEKDNYDRDYFTCKPFMGHETWTIVTPANRSFEVLPWTYNLGELQHGFRVSTRGKISTGDALTWLNKETDFLDQINKKLGVGAFEPSAPRTRDKTGSCPVCFQNIKLNDERMVLHGYKRPGTGSTRGSCWGVGFKAFELSDEGCKDYLTKHVKVMLAGSQSHEERLKRGEVTKLIMGLGQKEITSEDPRWEYHLEAATREAERTVKMWEEITEDYTKLIQHWKVRPLPKEGDRHIDWYYQGQKP